MISIFEAKQHLKTLAQESETSEGYEASQYLNAFINQTQSRQNYTHEYYSLIQEYGKRKVELVFTSGLSGYIDSRHNGNYSVDAIKQRLDG